MPSLVSPIQRLFATSGAKLGRYGKMGPDTRVHLSFLCEAQARSIKSLLPSGYNSKWRCDNQRRNSRQRGKPLQRQPTDVHDSSLKFEQDLLVIVFLGAAWWHSMSSVVVAHDSVKCTSALLSNIKTTSKLGLQAFVHTGRLYTVYFVYFLICGIEYQ